MSGNKLIRWEGGRERGGEPSSLESGGWNNDNVLTDNFTVLESTQGKRFWD